MSSKVFVSCFSQRMTTKMRIWLHVVAVCLATMVSARAELLYVTLDNKTVTSYDISQSTAVDVKNSEQVFLDLSSLGLPIGLAFDSASNVYVSDSTNSNIRKFSFSGSPLATISSNLTNPLGIAIDSADNLYAANPGGSVSKFSPAGSFLSSISTTVPQDVAFDSSGNIYISNGSPTNTVSKFDSSGSFLSSIGGNMNNPYGLTVDSSDNLFVANLNTNVSEFNSSGTFVGSLSPSGVDARANDVLFDSLGNLYVANYYASAISKFDADGTFQFSWSTPSNPRFMAVPEPLTLGLVAIAAGATAGFRRRQRPAAAAARSHLVSGRP
jgi:sugar lactone lactonase YvrE